MAVSTLCRGCMIVVSSHEMRNYNPRLAEMFQTSTGIPVLENDTLPKNFCDKCTSKIIATHRFIRDSDAVDILLRGIVSKSVNNNYRPRPHYRGSRRYYGSRHRFERYSPYDPIRLYSSHRNLIKIDPDVITIESGVETSTQTSSTEDMTMKEETVANQVVEEQPESKEDSKLKLEEAEPQKFLCTVCNAEFINKLILDTHIMTAHEIPTRLSANEASSSRTDFDEDKMQGQTYECPACDYSTPVRTTLQIHQIDSHRTNFVCKQCNRYLPDRAALSSHALHHVEECRFKCPSCNETFINTKQRKAHIRLMHSIDLGDIPSTSRG